MPRTTFGRCAKIARALCQNARSNLAGSRKNAKAPLPRTPEKLTQAISYPRLGTRAASMPVFAPSQTTRQPDWRRSSATARPGKTWPPAPPAMIMMVRATMASLRSRADSAHELAILPIDPQQHRERQAVREQAAPAEAHERKREALGGQHAHVHAHVDERLHPEPHPDPLSDQRRVRALQGHRLAADGECPQHQPRKERDYRDHPHESQLFADHREQEVGMRLREIEELLDARPQSDAEPFAAAECDERVRKLVAAAERIRPGINEAEDPLHAVRGRQDQSGEARCTNHDQTTEPIVVHAAE